MTIIDLSRQAEGRTTPYADILSGMCRDFGLDHIACGMEFADVDGVYAYSTYPQEWTDHYGQHQLSERDPVLLVAREVATPFDWRRLRGHANYAEVQAMAQSYGVPRNGMSFPVRGPRGSFSILSVSKDCTDSEWDRHISSRISTLMLLAVHLHESLVRAVLGPREGSADLPLPALDRRERQVLQAMATHADIEAAARSLGMSRRVFETHIKGAKSKLDALTVGHAVARATTLGLISPP